MPATAQDVVDVLRSIDGHLQRMAAMLTHIMNAIPVQTIVASDADLDGQWGDPVIHAKDPRDWSGESQLGKPFSECPPEYLDLVAARLDYFAERAEAEGTLTSTGKPVAPYNRKDAARARGWAVRLRNGWAPPAQSETGFPSDAPLADDSDMSF